MKKIIFFLLMVLLIPLPVFAGPTSTTYELKEYGFGSGGIQGATSTTYSLFGAAGEQENGNPTSTTYQLGQGLTFTLQTNVSDAPTFTNPSSNYDRLKFILNPSGTSPIGTDITYLVQVSTTSDFSSNVTYVQSDFTLGNSLVWQTYATWGGASGNYITGLTQNTTYYMRVKAKQGDYTAYIWSVAGSATTSVPSLTFGIDADTITFNNLNSGNSYTDTSKSTTFTTSTNAYNGYTIYGRVNAPLTFGSNTIANYASTNASPTTWSGTGFGYTTNDSSLAGGTSDRFTNGGPKYAGFGTTSPGDPIADHAGPVTTAISGEQFIASYRITVNSTTFAGTYTNTVLYIIVPQY